MKSTSAAMAVAILASSVTAQTPDGGVQGFDISSYQSSVDFTSAYNSGARFVIIKATEGTDITDSSFSSHYSDATSAGFIRGGYHFAHPSDSAGSDQANFFYQNGGGWSGDGITLPGMLDVESGSCCGSSECWGLSQADMVSWIADFVNTYQSLTGVYPIIYTSPGWWSDCTGNSAQFASTCPVNAADYNSEVEVPGGWSYQTIWQYNDDYTYGGDSDSFNGSEQDLQNLATNG